MDSNTEPRLLTNDELWKLAEEWSKNPRPIELTEIGRTRPISPDGLETFYDGDFSIKLPGFLGRIAKFLFE